MRLGILSDVHANLPALRAALAHLDAAGVDDVLCAGDLVGYGPHPDACVETLVERGIACVAGNHDLMAIDQLSDARCVPLARESQRWTRQVISTATVRFLAGLPSTIEYGPLLVAHGAIDDPEEYVRTPTQAATQLDTLAERAPERRLLVLGHTHRAWVYSRDHGTAAVRPRGAAVPAGRVLVNPGSVGQSRQWEREPRARCAVLDLEVGRIWFPALGYDWAHTRRDLERAGVGPRAVHAPPDAAGLYRQARRRIEDRTGLRLPRRRSRRQ